MSPPAIGVLLPLSGRYKTFGEPCYRGIRLALGATGTATPSIRTVVLDTKGDANEAARAMQRLAADPSIVGVLGPMLAWEVEAIAPYVTRAQLPVVTFSQRTPPPGSPIFRFSMTKEDQARTLARALVGERALRRWATIHPDDPYGQELAELFRRQVAAEGGEVVTEVRYQPGKTDFQTDVQRLQARIGGSAGEPPAVDGIFLPDSAESIALLAPHLAFFDIRNVQLAGAAGWHQPNVLPKALPHVNGALFVDGFFLYSFTPEVRGFVTRFRDTYHSDPAILDAYGYDAAALITDHVRRGATRRDRALLSLRTPEVRRGATGYTRIDGSGRVEKQLFLLTIEDGTIRELETAPPELPDGAAPVFPLGDRERALPPRRSPGVLGERFPESREMRRPEYDSRHFEAEPVEPVPLPPDATDPVPILPGN